MALVQADYDERYYFGRRFEDGGHPAGWSANARWYRTDNDWPGGSLGEYYLDIANRWINQNNLGNKKILEAGSGLGYLLQSALDLGVNPDSYGIVWNPWEKDNSEASDRVIVCDARLSLKDPPCNFKNNQFDVVIASGFFECFELSEVQTVINNLNTVSRAMYVEVWDDGMLPSAYYIDQTAQWWATNFAWGSSCIILSRKTGVEIPGNVN